jgi:flagellar basal body-associated protein FliL
MFTLLLIVVVIVVLVLACRNYWVVCGRREQSPEWQERQAQKNIEEALALQDWAAAHPQKVKVGKKVNG